jgi:GT2 family glycosyltransferase
MKLLDGLRAQTHPIEEVIVVDNGSTDGSPDAAEAAGARVIRLDTNYGFAKAVNRGIDAVRTELVAILNNDVHLAPDWLSQLADALDSPKVVFATGAIRDAVHADYLDATFDLPSKAGLAWRAGHGRPDSPLWHAPSTVRFTPFTAVLFRTSLFTNVGKLNEKFGSYLEDIEFCFRAALNGHEGRYVPGAVAWHRASATLGAWSRPMVRLVARNQLLLIAVLYPDILIARYAWHILVGQLLWGWLAFRHAAGDDWLKGKWEGLCMFGSMRDRASTTDPHRVHELLSASEGQIKELQRKTGFDTLWRVYFALT